MTGRSDSDKIDPDRGNTSGRLLFGAALIFAVGATLALVFATNAQWLKLAVIAALWAAFFGAMLSVKYRHQAAARAGEVADLQAVYELELEREVAARREYELEVEADTRRRLAEENAESSSENIAALRAELRALRENLERLTGGEVLVERFALRAQSTRMRSIGDPMPAPAIVASDERPRSITGPGRAPARAAGAVLDPSTELLEPAPAPRQRPDSRPRGPQSTGPRPSPQRRPEDRRPEPWVPTQPTGEQSRSGMRPAPVNPPLPRQPNGANQPIGGRQPSHGGPGHTGANPIMVRQPGSTGPQPVTGRRADDVDPSSTPTQFAGPAGHAAGSARRTGGRRHASEPEFARFDEDSFESLEPESFEQGGRHGSGTHRPVPRPVAAMSAPVPAPAYASAGARSSGRPAVPEPAGAHTAGRSVTELIAAHASAEDGPRRHRRRAE